MERKTGTTSTGKRPAILFWWLLLCLTRGMVVVMPLAVLVVMFNRMGMSSTAAALYTSLLLLPLALRPLSTVWLRAVGGVRWWIVLSLMVFAVAMYGAAVCLEPSSDLLPLWLCLVLMSLAGGVFEAAAALWEREVLWQWNFSALKTLVPGMLLAVLLGMGVMLVVAGNMEVLSRKVEDSWSLALKAGAVIVLGLMLMVWWAVRNVPEPGRVALAQAWPQRKKELLAWWKAGARRWVFVVFVLLFPMHKFFLWKGALLFLIDRGSIGGLMLSPQEVAFSLCTVATMLAMAGYVLGMGCVSRGGLRKWGWWMALAFTVPDAVYVFLAYVMPENLWMVTLGLSVELCCCGFGLAAFTYYIVYGHEEECPQVHLDLCWTLIVVSMVLTGIFTGMMQDYLGYRRFFVVVMLLAVLALAAFAWMTRRESKAG